MITAAIALLLGSFAISASASSYSFQTLNNSGDPNFNQLLGVNSLASPTITGYFGDGTTVPNNGYTLVPPGSYTAENYPGAAQTQVTGIAPLSSVITVGFYVDGSGDNIGFVNTGGTFTAVANPSTPVGGTSVNQLLGINDSGLAVGFYTDAGGDNHGYIYNTLTQAFTSVNLPSAWNAVSVTATGINDAGVISGFYTDGTGTTYGFTDDGGTFTNFEVPGGSNTLFFGINSSDQVVGSYVDGSGLTDGLLYSLGTNSYQTIDDPFASATAAFGVTGTIINGINNAGDLVGFYSDGTNVNGFEATPTPEPNTIWLLLTGVILLIAKFGLSRNSPVRFPHLRRGVGAL
ncbi:MAG: hypothetical protein ABR987_17725 [Terracidiphilus sp.]|jgi:hypothetical protein